MPGPLFGVKICGITSPQDAELSLRAGADAIGLNFCATSKRHVDLGLAQEIAAAARPALSVGVFVNSPVSEIEEVATKLALDFVQLHGDETPAVCRDLHAYRIIKAFRFRSKNELEISRFLEKCHPDWMPAAILVDSYRSGVYGGTGATLNWHALASVAGGFTEIPLVLAGGLTSENVAAAISIVRPAAVDTASGVESSPGEKDPATVQSFVAAAKQALAEQASVD